MGQNVDHMMQAALSRSRLPCSLRHSMPGAGTRSVESPWLAMEFIAGSRLLCETQQAAAVRRAHGGIWGARHAMHVRFGARGRAAAGCSARAKSAPPPDLDRPAFVHALGGGDRHPQALGRFGDVWAGCGAVPQAVKKVAQFSAVGLGEARAV